MKIPHPIMTGAAILALSNAYATADDAWTMDFSAAKATAADEGKDLLLEFTGSDWCPPCQRLNAEVFSQDAFLEAAPEHFVLVKLDFPNDRSGLTEEIQEQNDMLAGKYGVQGFPTIILSDEKGRPYARTGYQAGGAEAYLEHLESLRENRVRRDEALESAASAEGVEKAEMLVNALDDMGLEFDAMEQFYGDVIERIKANDPEDETGFVSASEARERLAGFQGEINQLAGAGDFEGILVLIDNFLEANDLDPEVKQEVMLTRVLVFAELGRFDEAIEGVDQATAIAPDSEIAPQLDMFKAQLVEARDAAQADD